jgi:hypothetical protein
MTLIPKITAKAKQAGLMTTLRNELLKVSESWFGNTSGVIRITGLEASVDTRRGSGEAGSALKAAYAPKQASAAVRANPASV